MGFLFNVWKTRFNVCGLGSMLDLLVFVFIVIVIIVV